MGTQQVEIREAREDELTTMLSIPAKEMCSRLNFAFKSVCPSSVNAEYCSMPA
jgi:hypothetical protein